MQAWPGLTAATALGRPVWKPVYRQRRIGRFHANVTLSVLLIYRFADQDSDHADDQP